MLSSRGVRVLLTTTLALLIVAFSAAPAPACRLVEFQFKPSEGLQIVIWVEDVSGNFVETVYMTDGTGRYGLGNRPGRYDFNSAWHWPYGRRTTTFPVWAGRSPVDYPKLVFQDGDDNDLSHAISNSSLEPFFCRPLKPTEADAMTCATAAYTDKGEFATGETSKYPPRNDMTVFSDGVDSAD